MPKSAERRAKSAEDRRGPAGGTPAVPGVLLRSALCALTIVALSCGQREPAPAVTAAARPVLTPLTVNVEQSIAHAPLVLAREEGYFAEEGIEVRLTSLDLNAALMATISGQLDVLSIPLRAAIFNLIARGSTLQIVADKGHHDPAQCASAALIAPVATAERVLRTRNFRGERFSIIRGGTIEFVIDRFLRKHGATLADVQPIQLPQGGSLQQEIDAIRFVTEPGLTNALRGGKNRIVAPVNQIEAYQGAVIAFGKRLLTDDPELGRRFMRAYLRGVRQYNHGKTARNVEILARHTKLPPEILRQVCWQPIAADGVVREEAVQPFLDWSKKAGYLDADVPASRWWNPAFVDAAARDLAAAGTPRGGG